MLTTEKMYECAKIMLYPTEQDLFRLLGDMDRADMESVLFFALGRKLGADAVRNKRPQTAKEQ